MARFCWEAGGSVWETDGVIPRVSEAFEGRGQAVPLLSGGTFQAYAYREDGETITVQGPRTVTFEWADLAPTALVALVLASWRRHTLVTVAFIHAPDFMTLDVVTGYVPAHMPPEVEATGGGACRLRVTVMEV